MRTIFILQIIVRCYLAFLLIGCENNQKEHFEGWKTITLSDVCSFDIPSNGLVRDVLDEDGEMKEVIFSDSVRISFNSLTYDRRLNCLEDSLETESAKYCNSICLGSSITATAACFPYLDSGYEICGTVMEMYDVGEITSFQATIQRANTKRVLDISFSPHPRIKRDFVDSILSQVRFHMN
jgi:hypothetical protein